MAYLVVYQIKIFIKLICTVVINKDLLYIIDFIKLFDFRNPILLEITFFTQIVETISRLICTMYPNYCNRSLFVISITSSSFFSKNLIPFHTQVSSE